MSSLNFSPSPKRISANAALIVLLSLPVVPNKAYADCVSPAGIAGKMLYNADHATYQFCNGTSWISMAGGGMTETDPKVGTLTASNFCTSNAGGTQILCTTPSISIGSISASGTASASTYLRGDGSWATVSSGSLPALTSAYMWVGNASNAATAVAPSGDISMTNAGAVTVTKINGATLGTTTATSGNLLIGSGTTWASVAVTGDVTITSGGVTAIGSGKVTNAMLAGSIAASKLVGTDIATVGTITTGTWNAGAVTSSGTITGNLFSGSGASLTDLNASNLGSGTVPAARLGSGTADSTTYLRGDSTWSSLSASGSLVQINYYSSTQTVTIPAGATKARVRLWGGSGGGGGGNTSAGAGGGGAAYLEKYFTGLTAGNTLALTIGAAGAAGSSTGNGGAGGNSSLASGTQTITTLTANGGGGGNRGYTRIASGGAGGAATNGDINIGGQIGMYGYEDVVTGYTDTYYRMPGVGGMTGGGFSIGGNGGPYYTAGSAGKVGGAIIEWFM